MFPVDVESVRFGAEVTDEHGSVEVYRRGGGDEEALIVDIAVKAPDGSICIDIRSLRYDAVKPSPAWATQRDDAWTLAHALEWRPWDEHAGARQAPAGRCTVAVMGEGRSARTLGDRLADVGYLRADLADARYVVYVADPGPSDAAETDIDCAVRLSADVADVVRRLTERDDDNPATLWIITRGVRDGISDAAVRQSGLWGLAGVVRSEQPQLWGGLVDIEAGPDHAPGHRELRDAAVGNSADAGQDDSGFARGRIPLARVGAGVRPAGATAVPMSSRCDVSHHRRPGRPRSADGRLARGPRCTSPGTGWPHAIAAKA